MALFQLHMHGKRKKNRVLILQIFVKEVHVQNTFLSPFSNISP